MTKLTGDPFNLDDIDLTAMQLFVLWNKGKSFAGAQVQLAPEVTEYLRGAGKRTIVRLRNLERRIYTPDMQLEDEECISVTDSMLIESSPIGIALFSDETLPLISPQELKRHTLALYAVVTGVGTDRRAAVRKRNPQVNAKSGRFWTSYDDTLKHIERPLLALDDEFDLLMSAQGVLTADQKAFESLFKDIPALQERIPEWTREIAASLPFGDGIAELLTARCRTDSRFRRRVSAIYARGHLRKTDIDSLRHYLRLIKVDEHNFIKDGKINVANEHLFELMYVLNEDYFVGELSKDKFRSERKASG